MCDRDVVNQIMRIKDRETFIELTALAIRAGHGILDIYSGTFDYELKKDDSPITAADRLSHRIISEGLKNIRYGGESLPVLSEEGSEIPYQERRDWNRYWLVDPLDGTKEFINRNGEFTVNIALIENGFPRLGIVYIPVTDTLYFGGFEYGSWKTGGNDDMLENAVALPLDTERAEDIFVAAGSRSHRSPEFEEWVNARAEREGYRGVTVVTAGSSLKFCLVAEGSVDVYPRFGPTMEWDIAAAQAVAEGAGKSCNTLDGGRMNYNKPEMRNSAFIVS